MSKKTIYDALIAAGLTKEGACGLMGNMRAESAMRSTNAQDSYGKDDATYTAQTDNGMTNFAGDGIGYGLCQWTAASRKAKLLAYAKQQGVSVGDEDMQVRFCLLEMMHDFPDVWAFLTVSHDLLQCAQLVCTDYERPAHNNVGTRYEYAQEFFAELAEGKTPAEEPAADACPIFPPDPSVLVIEMVMTYNGYWGKPEGYKTPEFFKALRQFTDDMEAC